MPPHAQPATAVRSVKLPFHPNVRIDDIARFNNWDKRECAISNALEWRERVNKFIKSHNGRPPIPKKIHQIWIGNREPPCIWLDSWRISFMAAHGQGWDYTLWDNLAVEKMRDEEEMVNGHLFDREAMWQCKADLLRLELLYRYGGVYIDADMISLGKSLNQVLEDARETGFGVSYEADTKDKPYSVLGNSIIFASKGHPLLLLIIQYIKKIYDHKRPHFGVEWVTGPLAFTKALLFSDMPLSMIPREYFYATFQYVPNPSAIDVSHFPHSLGFQFGYTCSGLGAWVQANNKCKKALDCPYHQKRTDYPLGAIKPFVSEDDCITQGEIPRVIHQFCFADKPPTRWMQTWSEDFCAKNPDWTHKVWTYDDLVRQGGFFCAHLYTEKHRQMDEETLKLLALEILFKEGGFYIPLTTIFQSTDVASGETSFPPPAVNGMAAAGTIVGSVRHGLSILKAIKGSYHLGKQPKLVTPGILPCADAIEMTFPDSVTSYISFATGSRFLGAGEIYFSKTSRAGVSASPRVLAYAYDSQVPCFPYAGNSLASIVSSTNSAVVVTDGTILGNSRAVDGIAGIIYQTAQQDADWDFIVLTLEWSTGCNDEVVRRMDVPFLRDGEACFGVVINTGRAGHLQGVDGPDVFHAILGLYEHVKVYTGTVRFEHNACLSAIYSGMSVVADAFWRMAGHAIPSWDRDTTEVHGRLLKGLRNGQLAFEINVDDEQRIMYRSFNDDGGINSEARILAADCAQTIVEHARVFFDHAIIFDGNNICLPRSM